MQVIYGPGLASNINLTAQKRLIRPAYAQTQGFPYAAYIDPKLRNADLTLNVNPTTAAGATRGTAVFTLDGSIVPGTVMVRTAGEYALPASGASSESAWGLLGQWIGGTFDNLGQNNEIGLWMGFDSVYELLAPAWNDISVATGLATAQAAGTDYFLVPGHDGRLSDPTQSTSTQHVCRVINRPASSRLLVQMVI